MKKEILKIKYKSECNGKTYTAGQVVEVDKNEADILKRQGAIVVDKLPAKESVKIKEKTKEENKDTKVKEKSLDNKQQKEENKETKNK